MSDYRASKKHPRRAGTLRTAMPFQGAGWGHPPSPTAVPEAAPRGPPSRGSLSHLPSPGPQPWQLRRGSATRAAPLSAVPQTLTLGAPWDCPNCTRERRVCSHLTRSRRSVFIDVERCPQHIVERRKGFTQQPAESALVHLKPCTSVSVIKQKCPRMLILTVPGVVSGSRIWGDFFLSSWFLSVIDSYNNEHVSYFIKQQQTT